MLTRIEIDGFKSFEKLDLDLQPFTVIVGPNASGKSNLFDALRFLSRLSQTDVMSAMRDIRGEPIELFRQYPTGSAEKISIAAEFLLNPVVDDAFEERRRMTQTRIRYEIDLVRRQDPGSQQVRVYVAREAAVPIRYTEDRILLQDYRPNQQFQRAFLKRNRQSPFLETKQSEKGSYLCLHQEGKQGRVRRLPAEKAAASALSTVTTLEDFPHLFALREELGNLRYLQLNPAAERHGSDQYDQGDMRPDGANLASVLARIETETATQDRPRGILSEIIADMAMLIPGVVDLRIERNEHQRQFQIFVALRDGQTFSSRVLSDGTLRMLALATHLRDPHRRGTLCFEEPENGIHEGRLVALIDKLRTSCADYRADSSESNFGKLFQIIVNTHSPVVMQSLLDHEIVVSDTVQSRSESGLSRRSRMRIGVKTQADMFDPERNLTRSEIQRYLRRQDEVAA